MNFLNLLKSMSLNIQKFKHVEEWKQAIFKILDRLPDSSNIIVPGGETPLFLYEQYFNNRCFGSLVLSDERITANSLESNFISISSLTSANIFSLCKFPIDDYKTIDLNEISTKLSLLDHPKLAILGLGEDGHYASIFPNSLTLAEDTKGRVKITTKGNLTDQFRVSLSENYIQMTNEIIFLIKGRSKSEIVGLIEGNASEIMHLPIGKLIKSYNGRLSVYYCPND